MWCLDVQIAGYPVPLKRPILSCILQDFYLIQDYDEDLVIARVERILDRMRSTDTVADVRLDCTLKRTVLHVRRLDGTVEKLTLNGFGCPLRIVPPARQDSPSPKSRHSPLQ